MTQEEQKAKEIIDMFEECLHHLAIGTNGIEDYIHERAVACGLLHVNGIIKIVRKTPSSIDADIDRLEPYWQKIKSIIQSL